MYYVIHSEFVGPDRKSTNYRNEVYIQTEPGRTNMSHEEKIDGWLGTTDGNYEYAHGEFETIEEAREYVAESWPTAHEAEHEPQEVYDGDGEGRPDPVVEYYRIHRVIEGEIITYDLDAEEVFEQFNFDELEFALCDDPGTTEVSDEIRDMMRGDTDEDDLGDGVDITHEVIQWAKFNEDRVVAHLRTLYGRVQVVDDIDGVYYILVADPVSVAV